MALAQIISPFPQPAHDHRRCVATALRQAESLCREQGLALTPLRRRVLELVWRAHAPIGAYDILDRLASETGRAAPPTVYRALDFLVGAGLVHRLRSLNAFIGCGGPGTSHRGHFLICRKCRSVAEISDAGVARALRQSAERLDFAPDEMMVEISGLCPGCAGHG